MERGVEQELPSAGADSVGALNALSVPKHQWSFIGGRSSAIWFSLHFLPYLISRGVDLHCHSWSHLQGSRGFGTVHSM